ncbi:DNA breaking-rejoining protein [Szabonella alba]|uniref:DNA breaking-rejoining protein n=1 Tax=Szabonella alba TaxID=2804194 RepID=A0A8K0VG93_9RHOB|nr:DNA breaking-rejoining protein [Szabonella alba]MBL4919109.1 DNA breaking-rejoining protein [Szabonella alba]
MTLRSCSRIAALLLMIGGAPALADEIRRETVHFAPGTSGSAINSRVKGYASVQYSLGVKAGQKMSVQLDSGNASLYFNITAPGANAALYNGSIDGNGTTVTIPSSGKYVIDVYLMRNAARRGETANYTLTLYVE